MQSELACSKSETDLSNEMRRKEYEHLLTVRLTYLAQSVRIKPNFQGLPWSEFDGLVMMI